LSEDFPSASEHLSPETSRKKSFDSNSKGQLSIRALLFLIVEAAVLSMMIRIAISSNSTPVPVIVTTTIITISLGMFLGVVLSFHFGMRWWFLLGPAIGAFVGAIVAALTIAPESANFRILAGGCIASTVLVIFCCITARYIPQEE
jgi:uncharacterized membrane protein